MAEPTRTPQPAEPPAPEPPAPNLPGSNLPGPDLPGPDLSGPGLPGPVLTGLAAVTGNKPRPEPLDPPMVPFAVAGLSAFALAGLVGLLFRGWLADHGHTDWLWICVGGFVVGLPGLATMIRHDAHRRRRRMLTHPDFRETNPPVTE